MKQLSTPEEIRERMGLRPLSECVDSGGSSIYGRTAKRGIDPQLAGIVGRPWSAPKSQRVEKPLKATPVAPGVPVGSALAWSEYVDGVEAKRSGQVWSAHWRSGVVWAAPADGGSAVAVRLKTMEVWTW